MLVVEDLRVSYGGIEAVRGVSFTVEEGRIVGLIGPNGAGKTSILRAISGLVPSTGTIRLGDSDLQRVSPWDRGALGLGHVPQGRRVFAAMSVEDNLVVGVPPKVSKEERGSRLESVFEIFPRLKERHRQRAGQLSGGEQQMLALGRGLMGKPELLMLDEPTLGLAPVLVDTIFDYLLRLHKERSLTLLLVEQRVAESLEFCDEAYLLETGRITMGGKTSTLIGSEDIQRRYLGVSALG